MNLIYIHFYILSYIQQFEITRGTSTSFNRIWEGAKPSEKENLCECVWHDIHFPTSLLCFFLSLLFNNTQLQISKIYSTAFRMQEKCMTKVFNSIYIYKDQEDCAVGTMFFSCCTVLYGVGVYIQMEVCIYKNLYKNILSYLHKFSCL